MSRSFVRMVVGLALVAAPMAVVEAQGCTVEGPATSCFINRNATVAIPTLAFINITNPGDIVLTTPANWTTFLTNNVSVVTETAAPLTLKSNTTFGVSLQGGTITGGTGRTLADHGFKFSNSGTCAAGGFTTLTTGAQTLVPAATAATNGVNATLCLESTFNPAQFTTNLAAGSYVIPLTLTITAP